MGKRTFCLLLVMILTALSVSGCWDKVEIDQRAFVGVIMVDMAPSGYKEKVAESVRDVPGLESQMGDMIKVTYAFPITVALTGEGGGDNKPAFTTLSSVATTMDKVNRYVDSRISRRLFFGFTQVIIFGEEFLSHPDKVKEVIDYFRRSPEFGRSMRVLVSVGEASKVADVKPKSEKILSRYIRGIMDNGSSNGRITDVTFNEFMTMMESPGTGVVPYITPKEEEVKIAGLALIKDFKLIGYLSEYDSAYYNAMNGTRKAGSVSIDINRKTINYVIRNSKREVKLLSSDPDNLEVVISVKTEGTIPSAEADSEIYDSAYIKEVEKNLNKVDKESCDFVIKKLQKEYKMDALMIREYLRKYHPDVWKKVEAKWDDIYPNIKIESVFDNKIRRIGTVK